MPISADIIPHELRVNLSTPGCPVTITQLSQPVLVEDGVRTLIGPIIPIHQELPATDPRVAQYLGEVAAAALADAAASRARVVQLEAQLAQMQAQP